MAPTPTPARPPARATTWRSERRFGVDGTAARGALDGAPRGRPFVSVRIGGDAGSARADESAATTAQSPLRGLPREHPAGSEVRCGPSPTDIVGEGPNCAPQLGACRSSRERSEPRSLPQAVLGEGQARNEPGRRPREGRIPIRPSSLGTGHSALSTKHSALSTQHSAPSTQHQALSTKHSALPPPIVYTIPRKISCSASRARITRIFSALTPVSRRSAISS